MLICIENIHGIHAKLRLKNSLEPRILCALFWFYTIEGDKIIKMNENERKCMKRNILLFLLISLQP